MDTRDLARAFRTMGAVALETAGRLSAAASTRRCRRILCRDTSVHDGHLTLLGRWRFVWRYRLGLR
jgi:hypothetical protein